MENAQHYRMIDGLVLLINAHSARLQHYEETIIKEKNTVIKWQYENYATHSRDFVRAMGPWLVRHGGPTLNRFEVQGIRHLWFKVRALFEQEETKELLHKSQEIEAQTLEVHRRAMALSIIPAEITRDIQNQIIHSEQAFDTIKMLQEKSVSEILMAS